MANFLANLGQGMRNFGGFLSPEFEAGASIGGGMRDRFRKKRPGEPDRAQPLSPTTRAPSAPTTDMLEAAVAEGENAARSKLPISADTDPETYDMMGELRAANPVPGLPNLPDRARPPLAVPSRMPDVAPPALPDVPAPRDYRGREIDSPIAMERDIYMRGKMSPEGGFKRSLGMTLKNALLGAGTALSRGGGIEAALGGAAAGAAGSLINPRAGYEFGFEYGERPRIEADIRRAREEEAFRRGERMAELNEAKLRGEIDMLPIRMDQERAQIEQMRASAEVARQNAERQEKEAASRIALNEARKKALETGKWERAMVYNPATGAIEEVWTNANGQIQTIGPSGRAEMARRKDVAAMQRTQTQQAGATGRTAMAQRGATERAQMRIDAQQNAIKQGKSKLQALRKSQGGGKTVSGAEVDAQAAKHNVDKAKWRAYLQKRGYTIKD